MTATQRTIAFAPLDLDELDARLDDAAARRGIPTLLSPEPAAPGAAPPAMPDQTAPVAGGRQQAGARSPGRASRGGARPAPTRDADAVARRPRTIPLNIEVPDYVWVELKSRSAQSFTTMRYYILKLLRQNGIRVEEADMVEDGRRARGRQAAPSSRRG